MNTNVKANNNTLYIGTRVYVYVGKSISQIILSNLSNCYVLSTWKRAIDYWPTWHCKVSSIYRDDFEKSYSNLYDIGEIY